MDIQFIGYGKVVITTLQNVNEAIEDKLERGQPGQVEYILRGDQIKSIRQGYEGSLSIDQCKSIMDHEYINIGHRYRGIFYFHKDTGGYRGQLLEKQESFNLP